MAYGSLRHELGLLSPGQLLDRFMVSVAQHGPGRSGLVIEGASRDEVELKVMREDILRRMERRGVSLA